MKTSVYRLVPNAREGDPNWDRAQNQGEVIVRAVSSGDARIIAAYAEAQAITLQKPRGTLQEVASAFRDVNLYSVVDDNSREFPANGPRRVLRAVFAIPDGYVGGLPDPLLEP